jgi:hypothetical protein
LRTFSVMDDVLEVVKVPELYEGMSRMTFPPQRTVNHPGYSGDPFV